MEKKKGYYVKLTWTRHARSTTPYPAAPHYRRRRATQRQIVPPTPAGELSAAFGRGRPGSVCALRDRVVVVASWRPLNGLAVGRGGGVHQGGPGNGLRPFRLGGAGCIRADRSRRRASVAGAGAGTGIPPVLGKRRAARLEIRREGPRRQHSASHASRGAPLRQVFNAPELCSSTKES